MSRGGVEKNTNQENDSKKKKIKRTRIKFENNLKKSNDQG
jgi:hypothetical protein